MTSPTPHPHLSDEEVAALLDFTPVPRRPCVDAAFDHVIFDANRDLLDDKDEVFVGTVLKIPVLKTAEPTD